MQALGRHDANVLEISLGPTPIASRNIDQRWWAFLIAAAEQRQHVHRPAGAMDQRGLDKVVAQDVPAERRLSAQSREAAMLGKGLGADDRVMAPIIAVAAHPAREPGANHRAINPRRELLNAREQRVSIDDEWQCLDDA